MPQAIATVQPPVAAHVVRGSPAASAFAEAFASVAPSLGGRAVILIRLSQPAPVSAAVVEALVDLLFEGGCADVTVAAALSTCDRDRGQHSVETLAHTAGLTGRSHRGRRYEVVDLGESTMGAPVPETSVLAGHSVSSVWVEADLRVVLARSVTSLADAYDGCLATLLGAAGQVAGADPADVATDLLVHLPPRLAVIDATVTSHGPDGRHLLRELSTGALVIAADALLADSALAALLGQDRSGSRLVARALRVLGDPQGRVAGDRTPFASVVRPHPLLISALRRAEAEPGVRRVLDAATGGPDEGAVPGDPVLVAIRRVLSPLVAAADGPAGHLGLLGLLTALAGLVDQSQTWSVSLAKDRVSQVEVPLGFDPASFTGTAYDELPAFFAPFEALLQTLPTEGPAESMRWRMLDGAVVFETSRVLAVDFADFVARVDVAAGISLMADYLGGRRVPVSVDDQGRVVRQAERNLYLPQPNYLAAWGGEPIDVCKIELVQRGAGEHTLWWRTVSSLNGSATWDDGSLTFTDLGAGGTRVSVRGRQRFTLPQAWSGNGVESSDLFDLVPEVKTSLVEEAYRRFFTATFDNLEACFEGRSFRIGHPAPSGDEPLATEMLHQLMALAQSWLEERSAGDAAPFGGSARDQPAEVDLHGFSHFSGPR